MRIVIWVIMAIKEKASEIISRGPAQCHPSVATRTPPSLWATGKGDATMWAWPRPSEGCGTGHKRRRGCVGLQRCLWSLVWDKSILPGETLTHRDHSSSPFLSWRGSPPTASVITFSSPALVMHSQPLAAQERCLPGKGKEHWYKRIILSKCRISGWGFPGIVSSSWGLKSHQG